VEDDFMSEQISLPPPPSPCVGICRIDEASGYCIGCARTRAEIASWRNASPETLSRIWSELPARRAALGLELHRLAWTRNEIHSFVADTIASDRGTWVGGVYGAVAEFCIGKGEPVEVFDRTDRFIACTPRAAISISLSDHVRALAFGSNCVVMLVAPRVYAPPSGTAGFKTLGLDAEAVRPNDRKGYLYDFGLGFGRSAFGVRTTDPSLRNVLDSCVGDQWPKVLAVAGRHIVETSPPRVIITPIGRIEVFTPIPLPGARTPPGPHTHFLPELLASGRGTAPGMEVPEAYVPCLIYYPAQSGSAEDSH
jgi:predicted Fe-S protein YdhL (DUF1289 family)